ncbi:EAL domain-containing protein [Alcaligenaceae bacterium]|nr:EAL domain-containing protein [Alcaligenaceae bacterium]
MSLLKQLLLSVTVAIIFILAGTLVFSIDGARQYLNTQLQAQSENAASSLALSLSQPANQDEITRELLIAALFDSGQFRAISLMGTDGQPMVERGSAVSTGAGMAPAWFSKLLPLVTPAATRQVSDGWKQVGTLTVTSDDLTARDSLWRSSLRVFTLVVGAGLLWALFAVLLIRWLKRALKSEITEQVRAIAEGGQSAPAPGRSSVAELAQATRMIHDVRERVRATAQEQNARIESLRLEVNQDPVTGLANRKYFLNELRRVLKGSPETPPKGGHVLLFRQRDLIGINATMRHNEVDQWLLSVGQGVSRAMEGFPAMHGQLARLNGSDFILLMPGAVGPEASGLVQQVRQVLDVLRVRMVDGRLCRWSLSLTDYTPDCDVSSILSRLDHGLMRAESAGQDEVEYISYADSDFGKKSVGTGEAAWRGLLDDALLKNRLELSIQPAMYGNGGIVAERYEASLALRDDDGGLLSAYLFMPAAVRLGLSADCDLRAIELGLAWLDDNKGDLIIKISLPSLLQPHFLPEMKRRLGGLLSQPDQIRRLLLEIDAHGLVAYGAEVQEFCHQVVQAGARSGLRRMAQQPDALMHLHLAPFTYVKLGGDVVTNLLHSPGARKLAAAIAETAIELDMKVYVDDVPGNDAKVMLQGYGALPRM